MTLTTLPDVTPRGYVQVMRSESRTTTSTEDRIAAVLGWLLVSGLYADGWAHVNVPGLETFFTPWHAVLYGSFALLVAWLSVIVLRRRDAAGWRARVPRGYGWGWAGVAVFAAGGLADMTWHLAFGVEAGIDALVSPTHLVLLGGGLLMILSPFRGQPRHGRTWTWPVVLSLAAATALVGFFLSYVSVFTEPAAREVLSSIPEGAPGHRAAELPAVAGLGGYLVTTLLFVAPLISLHRRRRLPTGTVAVVVAAVALPAAFLSNLAFIAPALCAVVGAVVVDLLLHAYPALPDVALAGLLPVLAWAGQLAGLAALGLLAWPPELWAGVVVLTALLAALLTWLLPRTVSTAEPDVVARVLAEFPLPLHRSTP